MARARSGSRATARARGCSRLTVARSPAQTNPNGRIAYHPPGQSARDTSCSDLATLAPSLRYPVFSDWRLGSAKTRVASERGASFGPSSGGTITSSSRSRGSSSHSGVSAATLERGAGADSATLCSQPLPPNPMQRKITVCLDMKTMLPRKERLRRRTGVATMPRPLLFSPERPRILRNTRTLGAGASLRRPWGRCAV